jgi:hypothetical protein
MGFGDAAKSALSTAVEALQAIAEVKAIVGQLQVASSSFERRIESKIDSLEARIRELERENAKLQGQVQAAYADALKAVVFDRIRDGVRTEGTNPPPTNSLPSGSLLGTSLSRK